MSNGDRGDDREVWEMVKQIGKEREKYEQKSFDQRDEIEELEKKVESLEETIRLLGENQEKTEPTPKK